jgi:hypothetical protein
MTKARTRLALSAVLALGVIGALAPSSAGAYTSLYNCISKPSNKWCDGRANGSYDGLHSYDYNHGWYNGPWDGSVWMCQHVWKPSTGWVLGGSCAYNWTSALYGNQTCVCFEAEVLQVSSGPKNINGHAEA